MNALMLTLSASEKGLTNDAWLMLAFGCVFLYGGLIYGVVRAVRGKLDIPAAVAEKAADVGWLVALAALLIVAAVGSAVHAHFMALHDETVATKARLELAGEPYTGPSPESLLPPHVLWWIGLYLVICVPLSVFCRHLIILQYRRRAARNEPPEA